MQKCVETFKFLVFQFLLSLYILQKCIETFKFFFVIQREIRGEENKKEIIGYNNIAHSEKFNLSLKAFDLMALFDVAPFGAPYSLIICMPQQRKF